MRTNAPDCLSGGQAGTQSAKLISGLAFRRDLTPYTVSLKYPFTGK
jgi:hypothetical protein